MEAKNDQHPMKGKQTPGKVVVTSYHSPLGAMMLRTGPDDNDAFPGDRRLCVVDNVLTEAGRANRDLYIEAHNVANEAGLWPREMSDRLAAAEEEIKKLREALKEFHDFFYREDLSDVQMPFLAAFAFKGIALKARALLSPEKNEP